MLLRYYLGIDGGQSSTTALIADEDGRVLGHGRGGPCNHVTTLEARSRFVSVLGSCLADACRQAALEPQVEFAAACLGFSGGPEDKDAYSREFIRSRRYKITHDAEIALTGATVGQPGIVVIAGTGSMAFGRNTQGQTARAGGWGYIMGDEGGAFDVARRALRAALQFEEGWGPPTELLNVLLRATDSQTADHLLHRAYGEYSRQAIAALAPLVTETALLGDQVARDVLESSAALLAWYAAGVYRNLFAPATEIPVAHVGATFRSEPLRSSFSRIVREDIGCPVNPAVFKPAIGALIEAMRLDDNSALPSNIPENLK